jgi:hypothetical protein
VQTNPDDPRTLDADERRREIALFRYGVIADLVHLEPHHCGLYALLAKKAEQDFTTPGSLRRHVAPETMRGWLRAYRRGGFDGGTWPQGVLFSLCRTRPKVVPKDHRTFANVTSGARRLG